MIGDFPTKDKKRAERRYQKERLAKRTRKIVESWFPGYKEKEPEKFEELVEHKTKRLTDNLKGCGCWMCRNPRKEFGEETFQEKKNRPLPDVD